MMFVDNDERNKSIMSKRARIIIGIFLFVGALLAIWGYVELLQIEVQKP